MTEFVYFDVGGVVILDFSGTDKWSQLKTELGILPEQINEFDAFWKKYEPELCAGRDVESLIPLIKKQFSSQLPKDYSLLIDGFVNRFEANKSIWPILEKIHKKCRIGLLTNMYPHMLDLIRERGILPDIKWDVMIDSSIEGIQKPDYNIFKLGEQKAGSHGKEILFVENSSNNLNAAKKFGWNTLLYDPSRPEKANAHLSKLF